MSCFQLSDRHHASIAHYVAECLMWPDAKIQAFADKLKRCNVASVNYRYDRQTPARKCKTEFFQQLDTKAYYDAIRCCVYQSCDNPNNIDYDVLRGFLFSLAHPGYSTDMPVDQWGID